MIVALAEFRDAALRKDECAVRIGRLALESLHSELICAPKPGLVTPTDCGSHRDMDAATFLRSLDALREYFPSIARGGMAGASFSELQELGLAAEKRMRQATNGINTHCGAIFSLGLIAAAGAELQAIGRSLTAARLCVTVKERWGNAVLNAQPQAASHGLRAAWRYGAAGARAEAAFGFPTVLRTGLPALRFALAQGCGRNRALVHALFSLIAVVEDTNLLYRGGLEGLAFARSAALAYLRHGSVLRADWRLRALKLSAEFKARNLSPGGAADLLAATWFVHRLETS
ncbi:MAG: triphosphoribosyl-dephospho-CoA synthase MdcB [Burkholderiales bacterium]